MGADRDKGKPGDGWDYEPDTSEARAIIFHELSLARKEVRSLQDFTDVALDSIPGVFYVFRETGEMVRWNRNLEHVTGYKAVEIAKMKQLDFFGENDRPIAADGIRSALLQGEFSIEADLLTKTGKQIPYMCTASRFELDGDVHLVGVGFDITDRKAVEERLVYQAHLLADVSDAVISSESFEKEFLIRSWNKGAERIYGWTAEEAVSRPYGELIQPEYPGSTRDEVIARFHHRGRFEGEVTHLRKDGTRVDVWTSVSMLRDADGKPAGAVAINRDITALKRAREAVAESERKYRHLVEDMRDVAFTLDASGAITYISPRVEMFSGWSPEDLTGRSFLEFVLPEDRAAATERYKQLLSGERIDTEFRIADRRGKTRWVQASSRPIEQNKVIVGARGVLADITERKRTEDEDLRIAKLESLAVLAGGVAHDFNNILTAVTANLSVAAEEAVAGENVADSIESARRAAAMAKALTQQLLAFSKGGEPVKKIAPIGSIVRESARFALSGAASDLELSIADDLWDCEVDPSQIQRVIENLVINADQAMKHGGTIEIRAENEVQRIEVRAPDRRTEFDKLVKIKVADHGKGIRKEDLQRVFDPYFTTKVDGNGLGLATVHNIVRRHGGRISVSSEIGQGTTFTVYLRAAARPARPSTVPPESPLVGGERILVMDDDVLVQQSSTRVLSRLGYDVEIVGDGEAAIERYERARDDGFPFDLVIMDLVIPGGMGGKEAIKRLLEVDPSARAIVSSGYSTDPVMSEHREHGFRAAMAKPWDLKEIGRTIREVLDGG